LGVAPLGRNKKMKLSKNKSAAILVAIVLVLSMSISVAIIPNASAHNPPQNLQLFAFIVANPNPAGVGQTITLGFWLNSPPPTANGPFGDRYGPMTVHVGLPDGTNITLGPYVSDDTGGTSTTYTPTETGTYTFQMTFPGETLTGSTENTANGPGTAATNVYVNDTILPATSNVATLTVQSTPLPIITSPPLPTNYWQTPVTAINVETWYTLNGAWLGMGRNANPIGAEMYNFSSNYNPYTSGPTTSHIMWTKPEAFGGTLGGPFPGSTTYGEYYGVSQYERKYNPVIINGYLYYLQFPGSSTYPAGLVAVNLYTGQTIWTDNAQNYGGSSPQFNALTSNGIITTLLCGQVLNFVSPDQYGGLAYLWTTGTPAWITSEVVASNVTGLHISGTTYNMYDAMTGDYILSIVNGTSISNTVDANGDMIGYYVNNTAGTEMVDGVKVTNTGPTLNEWNSTQCILQNYYSGSAAGWEWRPPQNGIANWQLGLMWSSPLNTTYNGNPLPTSNTIWAINSGVVLLSSWNSNGLPISFQTGYVIYQAYNSATGQQMWIDNTTLTPYTSVNLNCEFLAGNGIFVTETRETGVINGYSLNTGALIWSDNVSNQSNTYDTIGAYQGVIAGPTLYLIGFGGDVWSITMSNGAINWYTNTTAIQGPAGENTPYGTWPIWEQTGIGVAGGVLYLAEGHEYSPPTFLGAQQLALNTTTGQLMWNIDGFNVNGLPYTAYGVMTTINAYDNLIYAFGQGPSATTVSAPSIGVTTKTPITITGTVMDVSAGAKQQAVAANFPNGLPCVSDASQSQFMEAVYEQQPMPNNITGVPVTLSVIDSNGNSRVIGTTTTNSAGSYGFTWTPDITGNYTVIATFAGTGSYYGSSAQTYFYANAPEAAAPTPTTVSMSATQNDIFAGVAAIIVVMVVIGAVLTLLLLRKRP
jgi:hypothetical protein